MSFRNWLHSLTAGRVVVIAALIAIALGLVIANVGNFNSDAKDPDAVRQSGASNQSNRAAVGQNHRSTTQYEVDCSQRRDADLCAQRRMAKAADKQIRFSRYGLWLLIATTVFTGIAAVAAWMTLRLSKRTAERQLRAYLDLELTDLNLPPTGKGQVEVFYKITNCGQTPAFDVAWASHLRVWKWPLRDDFAVSDPKTNPKNHLAYIPPNGVMTGRAVQNFEFDAENMTKTEERLFIVAKITFKDAFNSVRIIERCASVEHLITWHRAAQLGVPMRIKLTLNTENRYRRAT